MAGPKEQAQQISAEIRQWLEPHVTGLLLEVDSLEEYSTSLRAELVRITAASASERAEQALIHATTESLYAAVDAVEGNQTSLVDATRRGRPASATGRLSCQLRQASGESQALIGAEAYNDEAFLLRVYIPPVACSGATLWIGDTEASQGAGYPLLPGTEYEFLLRRPDQIAAVCSTAASGAPYHYMLIGADA